MKLIFCGKKRRRNQWFCSSEKSSKSLKQTFFDKKVLPAYLRRYDLQNGVWKFFLNKQVSRNLRFDDFEVPENCSSQKKLSIKYQETYPHRFRDNDLTSHLVKFLQDSTTP